MKIFALVEESIINNWPWIQVLIGFILYSILEYYLGKTDKVKEGSLLEFIWTRIRGLFPAAKGIPNDSDKGN